MAEIPLTDEEMAMRRRARRRLVGAIALALSAIVVLPLLFDPEPKPLGPEVDIQIPGQNTPFEPAAAKTAAAMPTAPSAQPAVAKASVPPSAAPVVAPVETPKPAAKPAEATQPAAKAAVKPAAAKPVEKPAEKVAEKPTSKPAEKPAAADAKGYYLQLGVFDKKANAQKMADKARAAGFKTQTVEEGGHLRVRVGPVAERARADELAAQLKAQGLNPVLIAP